MRNDEPRLGGAGEERQGPPEAASEPGRSDTPPGYRRLWSLSLVLLGIASIVAVVLTTRAVVPAAADGVGRGVRWTVKAVGSGVGESVDAWQEWTTRLEQIAREVPPALPAASDRYEGAGSALLMATDEGTRAVALALLARSPQGNSTVILVPPDLLTIVPGYGDFPMSETTVFEDEDLTALTLTNLLGIRIDYVLAFGPGDFADAVEAPLVVDLPIPLVVAEGDEGRVVAKSGRAERTAGLVETILVTKGTGDELEWLQRQGAVWNAVLDQINEDPDLAARLAARANAARQGTAGLLAAGGADLDRATTVIPVSRVSVGGSTSGFTLSGQAVDPFVDQRVGYLRLRDPDRPRIELLNGNGRIATTRVVAEQLIERGYRVIKTDNADSFDYEHTQIIAQGRANRPAAEEVLGLLGLGDLLLEVRAPSGVVDISIIVGHDIPAGEA